MSVKKSDLRNYKTIWHPNDIHLKSAARCVELQYSVYCDGKLMYNVSYALRNRGDLLARELAILISTRTEESPSSRARAGPGHLIEAVLLLDNEGADRTLHLLIARQRTSPGDGESGEGGRVANNCCHYPRRASEWSVELLGSVDFEGSLRKYADQKALDGLISRLWLSSLCGLQSSCGTASSGSSMNPMIMSHRYAFAYGRRGRKRAGNRVFLMVLYAVKSVSTSGSFTKFNYPNIKNFLKHN